MTSNRLQESGVSQGRVGLRWWIIGYTCALLPLFWGMMQRIMLAQNLSWWSDLNELAPLATALRRYWLVTTPAIALGLVFAIVFFLRRHVLAAVLVALVLGVSLLASLVELFLLVAVQHQLATTISATMGIPKASVGGLHIGIAGSLAELAYKGVCLLLIVFGAQVRESFYPASFASLRKFIKTERSGR